MMNKVDKPTLRDQFAMAALTTCIEKSFLPTLSEPEHIGNILDRAAVWAYRAADAMLKEREK